MDILKFKANLFFPKGSAIDLDRLTGLTPAAYRLSADGSLAVLPSLSERELTAFSPESIELHLSDRIELIQPNPRHRLTLPPSASLQIACPSESFIREDLKAVPSMPSEMPTCDVQGQLLQQRVSPIGMKFNRTYWIDLPGEGRLLLPTLTHGLSDVLWFTPDQHFRGQFKLHSNVDLILTPLIKMEAEIVVEAIDLRAQSPSRLQTDAIVFKASPQLSVTIPAGVAFRIQGRKTIYFRAEYNYYADSDQKLAAESDVLWLGVGLSWPAVRVPTLRLSNEFVSAHFAKIRPTD